MDLDGSIDDDDANDYIREEEQKVDDEFEREYKLLMQVGCGVLACLVVVNGLQILQAVDLHSTATNCVCRACYICATAVWSSSNLRMLTSLAYLAASACVSASRSVRAAV